MGALDYKTRRHRRTRMAAEMYATWTPRRLFTFGTSVGGAHWFTDPNTLYRRRNRLTASSKFATTTGGWTRSAILSVTENADGVGDLVVPNTAASNHYLLQNAAVVGAGCVHTVRAKAGGYNWIFVQAGGLSCYFDLQNGVPGTAGVGSTTSIAAALDAPGYYDCTVVTAVATTVNALIGPAQSNNVNSFAADGTSGVYIARAQLEIYTTTPTEYQDVPTTWAQAYLDAVGAENIFAWTDSAGTTPVTAVGDTIGLSLDRAYGGMRGPNIAPGGGTFDSATGYSLGAGWSISGGVASRTDTGAYSNIFATGVCVIGKTYEISVDIVALSANSISIGAAWLFTTTGRKTAIRTATTTDLYLQMTGAGTVTLDNLSIREIPGTHLIQATGTARPTLSARVNLLLNTATMSTQNVTTAATSYKLSFTGTGTVTLSGTSTAGPLVGTGANDRVSLTFTPTAGTLTLTVSGSVTLADLRTADDAAKNIPAYQRVGATAADHDTDGFPHYAEGDGTDNCWASVSTVDGSATDKVTTVSAIYKNTDTTGAVVELTASTAVNNGGFLLLVPGGGTGAQWRSKGTIIADTVVAGFAAPGTSVLTGIGEIGADLCVVQRNGVQVGTTTTDQGTGNYSNATLYVMARGVSSLFFNGRIYSLVFRFGAMSATDRNRLEQWTKNLVRLP